MAGKAKVEVHQFASKLAWKTATWSFIYLWGYLTFSPGWLALPLLLSVIRFVLSGLPWVVSSLRVVLPNVPNLMNIPSPF